MQNILNYKSKADYLFIYAFAPTSREGQELIIKLSEMNRDEVFEKLNSLLPKHENHDFGNENLLNSWALWSEKTTSLFGKEVGSTGPYLLNNLDLLEKILNACGAENKFYLLTKNNSKGAPFLHVISDSIAADDWDRRPDLYKKFSKLINIALTDLTQEQKKTLLLQRITCLEGGHRTLRLVEKLNGKSFITAIESLDKSNRLQVLTEKESVHGHWSIISQRARPLSRLHIDEFFKSATQSFSSSEKRDFCKEHQFLQALSNELIIQLIDDLSPNETADFFKGCLDSDKINDGLEKYLKFISKKENAKRQNGEKIVVQRDKNLDISHKTFYSSDGTPLAKKEMQGKFSEVTIINKDYRSENKLEAKSKLLSGIIKAAAKERSKLKDK